MANSVTDGLYIVIRDGVLTSPIARFTTEPEAKADAEARSLADGSKYAVYKASFLYERIQTPSVVETVL